MSFVKTSLGPQSPPTFGCVVPVIIRTEQFGQRSLGSLQDLNKLSTILANVLVDVAKFSIKILRDPGQDCHLRIFKDLPNSSQDLQSSCQYLKGSLRIFKDLQSSLKILQKSSKILKRIEDLSKIVKDINNIFEDP